MCHACGNVLVRCALTVLLTIVLLQTPVFGQTTASDWMSQGLNSRNKTERITAFERAAELDPNNVETLYYLGRAYKENAEYDKAQVTLNKAYFKSPYALPNELKTRILYELGTVYAMLDKKTEARDALKSAKDLAANDSALRGRICYELGLFYIGDGEYERALKELNEGKSLAPSNTTLFNESIAVAESKKSLNEKYDRATELIEVERYEQAILLLQGIIAQDPGFKDTASLLQKAQKSKVETEQNKRLYNAYEQARRQEEAGNVESALRNYKEIADEVPGFQDIEDRIRKLDRNVPATTASPAPVSANNRRRDLESMYQKGVSAFEEQKWREAAAAFAEVRRYDRNFKEVAKLWSTTRTELARQNKLTRVQTLYSVGVSQVQKKQWPQARATLEQIAAQAPEYRDVKQLLQIIDENLAPDTGKSVPIDSLYEAGVFALQNGNWHDAVNAFRHVSDIDSHYKNVQNNLADAQFNLEKNQKVTAPTSPVAVPESPPESAHNQDGILLLTSLTVSMIALPLIGLVIFSPMTRARLYLLKGNYERAASIYLQMLQEHPDRITLYPRLARIYLIQDRRDDVALQIYESILKLDIFTEQRPQINSIVAQHYLAQGRTDEKAIEIMERELTASISKS